MMTLLHRSLTATFCITLGTSVLLLAPQLAAQTGVETSGPITGFTSANASRERATEAKVAAMISPSRADALSRELSKEPHMAGTPAQARTRDIVARELASYGITPEVRTYSIYMPHPTSVHLYRVAPDATELPLEEGPVLEDTTSWSYPQILAFNGYGAAGDATGDVIYVNYGLV